MIESDQVRVQDLDSTNGTLVNDRCLHQGEMVRVRDGDRLQVAQLSFSLRISADPVSRDAVKDDSNIVDWLTSPDAASTDAAGRTVLLDALNEPARPPGVGNEHGRKPSPSPNPNSPNPNTEGSSLFTFRTVDPFTRTTCFGLSPLQLDTVDDVDALRRSLLDWSDRMPISADRRLILDVSAIESLPSGIYALLLALSGRCQQAGGAVRLCGASGDIRRWLTALKLETLITCYQSRAEAQNDPWE